VAERANRGLLDARMRRAGEMQVALTALRPLCREDGSACPALDSILGKWVRLRDHRVAADIGGWRARLRALAGDASVPVHVEKLELIPQRAAAAVPAMEAGPAGELRALVNQFLEDPALLKELRETFGELKTRLETAVRVGEECVDPQDPDLLRKSLCSIEPLLMMGEEK